MVNKLIRLILDLNLLLKLTPEYLNSRKKGMNAADHIRYPVGFNHRHKCLFSLKTLDGPHLNYIEARKEIYLPLYIDLVKKHPHFEFLLNKVKRGENILIIEVDGPHQESLDYYKETYMLVIILLKMIQWSVIKITLILC